MDILIVILSSTWKFAATFPIAVFVFNMSSIQTIIYTNTGGFLGVIISLVLSKEIIKFYNDFWPEKLKRKRSTGKRFTRFNRRLVWLKSKYGLYGIAILTPIFLSIPVGTFLVTKYYRYNKYRYSYLLFSQFIWSVIYTLIYIRIKVLL